MAKPDRLPNGHQCVHEGGIEDNLSEDFGFCSEDNEKSMCSTFSAEQFVAELLNEASNTPCDESIAEFNQNDLPEFYDPVKFKRGQKFFKAHFFALYFNKFLGLIVTLSSPVVLSILQMTNMSGCMMTAYRRYVATLFHMNIWYESDLSLDSRSMQSIRLVKNMHNTASKKAKIEGIGLITQKEMVLTQFGFMGFAVARSEMIGIHNVSDEDFESFVHFWRVIGSLMGIQDRFNLCRESLDETRLICEVLIHRVLRPSFEQKDENFLQMTLYLSDGLWHTNPMINYRVFMTYLYEILKMDSNGYKNLDNLENTYFNLTFYEKLYFKFLRFVVFIQKFNVIRIYLNFQQMFAVYIVGIFPFLAVQRFGYRNSIVQIPSFHPKQHSS